MDFPTVTYEDLETRIKEVGLGSSRLVKSALFQAQSTHSTQKRHNNAPYLEQHIYPVVSFVIEHELAIGRKVTPRIVAGAAVHDVLDDDIRMHLDMTIFHMFLDTVKLRIGEKTYRIVEPLWGIWYSKLPDRRERIIARLKRLEKAERESRIIALADKYDNLYCIDTLQNTLVQIPTHPYVIGKRKANQLVQEVREHYLPFAANYSPYFYRRMIERLDEINLAMTR